MCLRTYIMINGVECGPTWTPYTAQLDLKTVPEKPDECV